MTIRNILEIAEAVNNEITMLIDSDHAISMDPKDLGMDPRAGNFIYMDLDTSSLMVPTAGAGSFEYYSGFDYIADDQKTTVGSWIVYHHPNYSSEGNTRVSDAVDFYKDVRDGKGEED